MKYFKERLNRKIVKTMEKFGFHAPVFEIGCGTGESLEYISSYYDNCKGVDLSARAVSVCKTKGLNVHNGDLLSVTERFNSLVCIDVLEHVEDDTAFVRHMYRILNDGGKLLILVPSGKMLKDDILFGHYRRYSRRSITELLKANNFVVESVEMLGYPILYYTRLAMNYIYRPKVDEDADLKAQTIKSSYEHPFDDTVFAKLLNIKPVSSAVSAIMRIEDIFAKGDKGFAVIVVAGKP